MKFNLPNLDQIIELAKSLDMTFDREMAVEYRAMMAGIFEAYNIVDSYTENLPNVRYPRSAGRPCENSENPYGAWIRRLDINGSNTGILAGRTIAVKDSIMVAGVPMTAGTRFFSGYVPEIDAEIITRLLDAGAKIIGKTVCEYLGISGSSHTGYPGHVLNPWNPSCGAGGSSSGSAVAVAIGDADMALGTDQGGSIRIPASWCGIVGLKPTYGLVPYTGISPIEMTLDHAGPLTRNVRDSAAMLTALAGYDPLDPRQNPSIKPADYLGNIDAGLRGLRIGIVKQGFGWSVSETEVDELIREQANRLRDLGAELHEIDIPIHRDARNLWTPLFIEGFLDIVMRLNGSGTNHRGLFVGSASDAFARWRSVADELSASTKVVMLAAKHFQQAYNGRYYGRSQNIMRDVAAAYDAAFTEYDLLLMPTTPMRAQPLPPVGASDSVVWDAALGMNLNTAPFCSTGHPAISIPCGLANGLPVGLMLVARYFDEVTIFRAAEACEKLYGHLSAS